jgi:DNA-binding MarR family transcriptional regulator
MTARNEREPAWDCRFIDDYLPYLLARASFLVSERFHVHLRPAELAAPEWRVLSTLSDGSGLSVSALARIALYKQPTMTKIIDRMVARGLVRRAASPGDRRKVLVFATEDGRALVAGLLVKAKHQEEETLRSYAPGERAALKHMLRTLIARLDPDEEARPRAGTAPGSTTAPDA